MIFSMACSAKTIAVALLKETPVFVRLSSSHTVHFQPVGLEV